MYCNGTLSFSVLYMLNVNQIVRDEIIILLNWYSKHILGYLLSNYYESIFLYLHDFFFFPHPKVLFLIFDLNAPSLVLTFNNPIMLCGYWNNYQITTFSPIMSVHVIIILLTDSLYYFKLNASQLSSFIFRHYYPSFIYIYTCIHILIFLERKGNGTPIYTYIFYC